MRWFRALACIGAVLLPAGCGDHFEPLGLGDSTSGEPEPTFDYAACPPAMRDPSCTGSACGIGPEAQDRLAIFIDEVEQAGHAEAFVPTKAEYFPHLGELRIDYQLQVGWFRFASSVRFDVPDTEALLRQEIAAHVAGWRVPSAVARPEELAAAVEGCHALLEYDPCTDNQPDFLVHERYDWAQPECVYKSTVVVVDAADASTLECMVETPQPCG